MATINYLPALRGRSMWNGNYFDLAQITRDFRLLRQTFAFDVIKVFAVISASNATDATGSFNMGGAGPTTAQKARLTAVCNAAVGAGARIHLTLFDGWTQYGAFDQGTQWINALGSATPVGVDPSMIYEVIEFQHEPPFDSTATYTAGGTNAVTGWTVQQAAVAAAQNLIPVIRAAWPSVPVTISSTNDPHTSMAYAMANLTGASRPDWVEPHLWAPNDTLTNMQYIVATWSRSARIGAFGSPTFSGGGESGQSAYYSTFLTNWASANPTGYPASPWMAFDADAFQALTATVSSYGLIALNGHYKTAAIQYLRPTDTATDPNRFMLISGQRFRAGVATQIVSVDATATATTIPADATFGSPTIITGSSGTITVTDNGNGTATISGTGVVDNGNGTVTISSTAGVTDNGDGTVTLTTG